ncbi:hypothetical protein MKJ01_02810 [Chryseobacterium sp. SSA4.19]|uniref:type II CRISPR RNA-guided endonuclease Cas9 n=1 Tax=Chryseobacterium sp. SSA4.19 TaxID=2919915 RepID=UPI001F4E39EA|nr:type II CRISPR RNA-guided endonuclease Cas9 [Chryseobacterium sp. SSA4.19]MCJ8152693.1 hypothetical protein [Chryseobacterium sp. SSA4.19]
MTKNILGLDLGTNSIGWALIQQDFENKKGKILGMGSRIIPMGTDKQDYEKGVGITKNADRRTKRTIRKMNKRYKLRRNKLLYILHELEMLPEQFQLKNGIPEPNKIQDLELLPIKKGTMQLNSLTHYKLRASAIDQVVGIKDFGKILYQFNQLRGYSGGNNEEDVKNKKKDDSGDENESVKKYEVITQKVLIQNVELSDTKFKGRGKNKDLEYNKFNVTVLLDDEELEGETELQNLSEKINQEEELEIRIRRNKKAETTSIVFALPQKTNWRKQMEKTEEDLKQSNLLVSQLFVKDLEQNKWTKIRNRFILRNRYQEEFDAIWNTQSKYYSFLNDCAKDKLEKIANYLFPGKSKSQERLRKEAISGGLKYIIKNQVIYYQRPLKPQTELISKCQFEKEKTVLPNSHPLFQNFRCWDQINRMYITSKQEAWNERKSKNVFQYSDRFLTTEQKQQIYQKLQIQKQVSFSDVAKIINLKSDKTEYLNGLNAKAKLKGCDTVITIKKALGEHFDELYLQDNFIVNKLWKAIFDNANNGSEYDAKSPKVSSIIEVLKPLNDNELVTEMALRMAQTIKFPRKYSSLSEKAIINMLPLMGLSPLNIPENVKQKFNLIKTGEIVDGISLDKLEDYVCNFIESNPDALSTGGLMYAFASSLVYGRHTQENIKPQIKYYHDIKYSERNLRNPIVSQLVNETMQIVKSLWKQYQFNPEELEIRIELARDLKNSAAERDKIFKGQIKSQRTNDGIKKRLQDENIPITDRNILKYKLYEQQKFMSPYTKNKIIPFSSLFDDRLYDIDHIIPKSRYFDDSLSNKVVCETYINEEKSNRTAWEYISQQNSRFDICSESEYVQFVNDTFYGKKKKNLLLEKIPKDLVERSIKNTQYISVAVKNELAKIVGSKNVGTTTGEVTDFLRSRWGLRDLFMKLTKDRFKQMELWDINPETGAPNEEWVKMKFDERKNKKVLHIKNWSKRYDHRHHAIDALVVALTRQNHIQRLNNLNKYLQDELIKRKEEFHLEIKDGETILEAFFNLEKSRREEIQKQIESSRFFDKPFDGLVEQAKNHLEAMTVSIKPKDKLGVKKNDDGKLQLKIRGALHQETNYGKTKDPKTGLLRDTKTINLSNLKAKDVSQIIDEVLQKEVDVHKNKYESVKEAFTGEGLKVFNESRFQTKQPDQQKPPVYKVKVWYSNKETEESTLQRLYKDNEKLSVVTGDNYLFLVMEKDTKKGRERVFDIASLYDSADIAKSSLKDNDENFKQKISEAYRLTYGERNKLRGKIQENPDRVLFTLQQNDLVYLPENGEDRVLSLSNEELKNWLSDTENKKIFSKRVYKVAKFGGKDCHFVPHNYANVISIQKDLSDEQKEILKEQYKGKAIPKRELNFVEFGSYRDCSPYEAGEIFTKSLTTDKNNKKSMVKPIKIQDTCIKLNIDWLGNISRA